MSLFKAAVVKIQRGQAFVKPLKAGPLSTRIVLDGKHVDEYKPGREILGHVEVSYNQEFLFCGLKLTVEALIHMKYREGKHVIDKKESIWTESTYLIGQYGQTKTKSKAGSETSYAFSFKIPSDLPGSYKSEIGSISYHLFLQLDYGDNKYTRKANRPITVRGDLELDPDDPSLSNPIEIEERDAKAVKQVAHNKKSTDGQLRFYFRIEQSGFLSGEKIPFEFEIENPRKAYKIEGMRVDLIEEVIYHGGKIQKTVRKGLGTVTHVHKDTVPSSVIYFDEEPKNENRWEGSIDIPTGLYPTTKNVIQVHYSLKVTLTAKTVKLIGNCPIIIGTTREGLRFEEIQEASKFYDGAHLKAQDTLDDD